MRVQQRGRTWEQRAGEGGRRGGCSTLRFMKKDDRDSVQRRGFYEVAFSLFIATEAHFSAFLSQIRTLVPLEKDIHSFPLPSCLSSSRSHPQYLLYLGHIWPPSFMEAIICRNLGSHFEISFLVFLRSRGRPLCLQPLLNEGPRNRDF